MIVFAHLYNDRSGSPRVLKTVIESLAPSERCMLFLGSDGDGILSSVKVETKKYWYWRTGNRVATLLTYLFSQVLLFVALLRARLPKDAVIYVNTLLPFGAALYGKLTRRCVVFHVHEISISPTPLRAFLGAVARHTAFRLIYVSNKHRALLPLAPEKAMTIHNAVDPTLHARADGHRYRHRQGGAFVVLMLVSPAPYKGIDEFVALADRLADRSDIQFHLVLSRPDYAKRRAMPSGMTILPPTDDPGEYYAGASLVLNLSRPDLWVETFGLTLLEGMTFGVPVIAPPVGGPAELVANGREGYLIDCRDGDALASAVIALADDEQLCMQLSYAARKRAATFSPANFGKSIASVVASARDCRVECSGSTNNVSDGR